MAALVKDILTAEGRQVNERIQNSLERNESGCDILPQMSLSIL